MSDPAKDGDKVRLEYVGSLDDGTVFDCADECCEPFEFVLGSGDALPAFEEHVRGMSVGESKEFVLEPGQAYGENDPSLVREVPRDQFPDDAELEEGMMIVLSLPDGTEIPAIVAELGEKTITLDLNHPLSGMRLHFKLTLVSIG
jgi:FKBP-type peptidyl-prolyl cis-trans isomerase 2